MPETWNATKNVFWIVLTEAVNSHRTGLMSRSLETITRIFDRSSSHTVWYQTKSLWSIRCSEEWNIDLYFLKITIKCRHLQHIFMPCTVHASRYYLWHVLNKMSLITNVKQRTNFILTFLAAFVNQGIICSTTFSRFQAQRNKCIFCDWNWRTRTIYIRTMYRLPNFCRNWQLRSGTNITGDITNQVTFQWVSSNVRQWKCAVKSSW